MKSIKKIIAGLSAVAFFASAVQVYAAAYDYRPMLRSADNTFNYTYPVAVRPSNEDGLIIFNGVSKLPDMVKLGSKLVYTASTSLDVGTLLPSDITGLTAILDAKASSSAMTALLDGKADLNHIHAIASTTGLQAALDGKAALSHTHEIASTTGLQAALDSKAASSHTHAQADITGLVSALAGKFAVPAGTTAQYVRGDGSLATFPTIPTGTVTSVGISSSDFSISGSPVTTSGTITANLNASGVSAGTYSSVTVNTKGIVTAGTNISINDAPGRSLVTATNATGFQISSTRPADVCYEGTFQTTSTIGGPAAVSVYLETADTNSTTPGDWTIKATQTNSNTITLAVALNQVDVEAWSLCRKIPAGKYVRIRQGGVTGTASATINTQQQETTL